MKNWEKPKGITLIALVITIIVLLILAGISIATLTGENGVLTKASEAKNETQRENAKEKVQVAVMGSYGTDSRINLEELNANLKNVEGLTYKGNSISETNKIENLEDDVTVEVDGYDVIIEGNGKVSLKEEEPPIEDSVIHFSINEQNITVREAVFNDEWEQAVYPSFAPWLCELSNFTGFTLEFEGMANPIGLMHNGRGVLIKRNGEDYGSHPTVYDPPQEGDKFILTYEDTGEKVPLEK